MALLIEKPTQTSATMRVSYWRIGEWRVVPRESVSVIMHGYWSEDDRRAGMLANDARVVTLQAPDGEVTMGWLYEQVKETPEFAGAADA